MILLLTGASGSFGAQLLEALCEREDVRHVFALAHRAPLVTTQPKVSIVFADITEADNLGLPSPTVRELTTRLTGIVHAAAETRFTAPEEVLRRINVEGTANMLAFARRCPQLDRFCLLSTVYVAGARTGTILEDELDHQAGFINPYERSKYDAETLAREMMRDLPLVVMRLSTVIGEPPGHARPLGAIHQAIRLMYRSLAPMVPGGDDHPVDLVPATYAAGAIGWLATRGFSAGRTFHVAAGSDTIAAADLLDFTMETFARSRPAWRTRGIARPTLVDLTTFELFRRSVDEVGDWLLRDSTAVISSFAPQLAYPKVFDDRGCRQALEGSGITRSGVRAAYARMVEQVIGV